MNTQSQTLLQMKLTQKDLLVALVRVLSFSITTMKIIKFIVNQAKSFIHLFYIAKRRNCSKFQIKKKDIKDRELANSDFACYLYSTVFS